MGIRGWYELGLLLSVFIIAGCLIYSRKQRREYMKEIQQLLLWAAILVSANLSAVSTDNEMMAFLSYSFYFISIDLVLDRMLLFVISYGGFPSDNLRFKVLRLVFILSDILLIGTNLFARYAVDVEKLVMNSGESYYTFVPKAPFYYHLGIDYIFVLSIVVLLIYRMVFAPQKYKLKYLVIFLVVLFVVLLNAMYLFAEGLFETDISVLTYAIAGIGVFYCANFFMPGKLMEGLMGLMLKDMTDYVFILDCSNVCAYSNLGAQEMFEIHEGERFEQNQMLYEWFGKVNPDECCDYEFRKEFQKENSHFIFHIQFQRLEDDKKRYQGCFFMIEDITAEVEELDKKLFLARHDSLTGLYNKEAFYEMAEQMLYENPDTQYLMICSDIRNFKMVNDVFGTKSGDEILCSIAKSLREKTVEGELFARLHGDRFAMLMPKLFYRESVFAEGLKEIKILSEKAYALVINIGVYEIEDRRIPISMMCDRALMAIQKIKDDYRVNVAYYDDNMRIDVLLEQVLSGELESAITEGQIKLFCQPQVTKDGTSLGGEVLVRWEHPERGMLMPGVFIPMFEKNGMISKLDYYIWEEACRKLKEWKENGKEEYYLSVNISPKDMYYLDIYETFTNLVRKYDISPSRLKLEITETAVMLNLKRQLELISKLQEAGFIIEMDDFGSGFSSLNMLKEINVDILKIDMAFLRATENEQRGRTILSTIIQLSKSLGMPVIVEGVETKEQLELLTGMGSDYYQGYYFAKPMEMAEFEQTYVGLRDTKEGNR